MHRLVLRLSSLLLLAAAAGCVQPAFEEAVRMGPFFQPNNVVGERSLGGMRRVVVLPVYGGVAASEETAAGIDAVVIAALQRENRFEVVPLSRAECLRKFQVGSLGSTSALPADFLGSLRREFAADGVLFVDLTVHRAYRPLTLGLRAKLAAIDGRRLVWSFDNVFSADDPTVANAARHHFLDSDRAGVPADLTPSVLQSPGRFATYAAAAMFETLPPVVVPVVIPKPRVPLRPLR
jgi:hypothetical protein